jgi:hypothetical protein
VTREILAKIMLGWKDAKQKRIIDEQTIKQEQEQNRVETTSSSSSEFSKVDDDYEWSGNEDDDPDYVYVEEEDWNEEQFNKEKATFIRCRKYDGELGKYSECKKEQLIEYAEEYKAIIQFKIKEGKKINEDKMRNTKQNYLENKGQVGTILIWVYILG